MLAGIPSQERPSRLTAGYPGCKFGVESLATASLSFLFADMGRQIHQIYGARQSATHKDAPRRAIPTGLGDGTLYLLARQMDDARALSLPSGGHSAAAFLRAARLAAAVWIVPRCVL